MPCLLRRLRCFQSAVQAFNTCLTILCPGPPRRAGVPFRETHHISGAAVKMAEDRGCGLSDLSVKDLQTIHPLFSDDVVQASFLQYSLPSTCCHVMKILLSHDSHDSHVVSVDSRAIATDSASMYFCYSC